MYRAILVGVAMAVSAGCAAPGAAARQSSLAYARGRAAHDPGAGEDEVCQMEAPTGTHLRRSVCRSERSIEARRLDTLDRLRLSHGVVDDLDFRAVERVYGY